MEEANEMFGYLNEHPTTADILAIVHGVKSGKKRVFSGPIDQAQFEQNMFSPEVAALGPPEKPPDDFMQNVSFGEDLLAQMRAAATRKSN